MSATGPKSDATGRSIPELLTRPEAARILRISQRKLAEMKASGQIPYVQIGKSIRFDIRDLQAWIDEHRFVGLRRVQEGRHE